MYVDYSCFILFKLFTSPLLRGFMKQITQLNVKISFTLIYFIIVGIFWFFNIPCFSQYLFNIPCPGCGISRAVFSAFRLDFVTAFRFHPMFWSLPILYLYFLYDGKLFKNKSINLLLFVLITFGFILNWILALV